MFHYQTVEELRQAAQEEGVTLPLGGDLSPLGQELEVQGVKLPNRVAIQPMEGCDGTADGKPGELTLRRYDKFARSGAGLLWEEATAVWEEARANPRQLWIKEENVGGFPGHEPAHPGALPKGERLRAGDYHAGHPLRAVQQAPGRARAADRLQQPPL